MVSVPKDPNDREDPYFQVLEYPTIGSSIDFLTNTLKKGPSIVEDLEDSSEDDLHLKANLNFPITPINNQRGLLSPAISKLASPKLDSSLNNPRDMAQIDMNTMNDQIFGTIKKHRIQMKGIEPIALPIVTPQMIKDQGIISARFLHDRLKMKFNREIEQKLSNSGKFSHKSREGKKRVTNLTMEVTKAMKRYPIDIVDIATNTFDNLDRIRKVGSKKLTKELKISQEMMPNYLSVVLNLKKSKKEERIGQIASKCSYIVDNPDVISNSRKRLNNLMSLDQIGTKRTNTAFEAFCLNAKQRTLQNHSSALPSAVRRKSKYSSSKIGSLSHRQSRNNLVSMQAFVTTFNRKNSRSTRNIIRINN